MSGYFTELALSIDEMLGDDAPAVEAGIADELSERRGDPATGLCRHCGGLELAGGEAGHRQCSGDAIGRACAGIGKGSAKVSSTQRPAAAAQAKTAAPSAVKFAATGISTPKRARSARSRRRQQLPARWTRQPSPPLYGRLRGKMTRSPFSPRSQHLRSPMTRMKDGDGGGGGGGGSPFRPLSQRPRADQARRRRSRRALRIAAGAQPAVFKVISTAGTKGAAGALLEYLGTRPDEDGKKHDIEVFTSSGLSVETREQRRALLEEWQEDFREPFQNTNFIEVDVELAGDPGRE